ncbi:hypothetical protein CW751_03820 [Brumimicrobium salinarum]|uniref:Uncharacterized protein n=1 Tax=Brumimicrobium salinarum TaxID=2058658 RepID=A0A2I0R4Z7_9FLAO|nr:hypothetical protein [Brumimicrobium salinarum]PKR81664.1 hypothetical protein CW751_03820 [Brumimicrobium salinarum]
MNYTPELYEQKLVEFFERHDESQKHLAPKIATKFPKRQEEVFKHLTAVYAEKEGNLDAVINEESIMAVPPSPHTGVG